MGVKVKVAGGVFAGLLAGALTGCIATDGPSGANGPTMGPDVSISGGSVSAGVVLDWNAAAITLPIDQYGMSTREAQIVEAAGSIEFARCTGGGSGALADAVDEAVRYLATDPMGTQWLYGYWDASYIAQHGWIGYVNGISMGSTSTDPDTGQACQDQLTAAGLVPLANGWAADTQSEILTIGSGDGYAQMTTDPAFADLQSQWRDCVARAGYKIDTGYDTSAAWIDPAWNDEQVQKAALADATCADAMSYTQQVGDIDATYQMAYIRDHEAELVQTKQIADQRVATATQILRDAGVM